MNNPVDPKLINQNYAIKLRPWLVVFSAASFVVLTNLLINLNTLTPYLSRDFHFSAKEISLLFASYYYTNILFVFWAGMILDRVSLKKVLVISFIVANCSTLVLATTKSLSLMIIARLCLGIVGSFSMLNCFLAIQRWFPKQKVAFVTCTAATYAALGSLFSQTPLALTIEKLGWQNGLLLNFGLGVLLMIFAVKFMQDYPLNTQPSEENNRVNNHQLGVWTSIKTVVKNPQNWLFGLYVSLFTLPNLFLSASWGILYLEQTKNFKLTESSMIISTNVLGAIVGPFIIGWSLNRFRAKKLTLVICTILAFLAIFIIACPIKGSLLLFVSLFFLLGVAASAMILIYPLTAENNPKFLSGIAMGFVATLNALSGSYVPILGWLIDRSTQHLANYNFSDAVLVLIIVSIVSVGLSLFIKEPSPSRPAAQSAGSRL